MYFAQIKPEIVTVLIAFVLFCYMFYIFYMGKN